MLTFTSHVSSLRKNLQISIWSRQKKTPPGQAMCIMESIGATGLMKRWKSLSIRETCSTLIMTAISASLLEMSWYAKLKNSLEDQHLKNQPMSSLTMLLSPFVLQSIDSLLSLSTLEYLAQTKDPSKLFLIMNSWTNRTSKWLKQDSLHTSLKIWCKIQLSLSKTLDKRYKFMIRSPIKMCFKECRNLKWNSFFIV